jgi:hypothetical protein
VHFGRPFPDHRDFQELPMSSGYVDFPTLPAGAGSTSVPDLGRFSTLAGPVVGADGTVYLASLEGKVIALRDDGQPYWTAQIDPRLGMSSPPAIGIEGSAYVVGWTRWVDHRTGLEGPGGRGMLYRFLPEGVGAFGVELPLYEDRGAWIYGAPEMWRAGDDEAILVPAIYSSVGGFNLRLLAFSTAGEIIGDWVKYVAYGPAREGGSWKELAKTLKLGVFEPGELPPPGDVPLPGVAIAPLNPLGGTPSVVLIDRFEGRTFTFRFCTGAACAGAEAGLFELFPISHSPHELLSSAVTLPGGQTVIGAGDGLVFTPPGQNQQPTAITGLGKVFATPSLAMDGRIVAVNLTGQVYSIEKGTVVPGPQLQGFTIARPAASKSHVFVATTEYFYTLNATATAEVARFPWTNAGVWSPVVGPKGKVYAMAANTLFIFPGPRVVPVRDVPLGDAPAVALG